MSADPVKALLRQASAHRGRRVVRELHDRFFGRPFGPGADRRLLILFEQSRIAYASVYPFLSYSRLFRERHGVEIRLLSTDQAIASGLPAGLSDCTHVLAQSWLTDPPERHASLAQLLAGLPAETVTAYLDSSANIDIRLAATFSDVDFYFKKSLLADPAEHLRATYGHTNLTEYYGRLYDCPQEPTDWHIPDAILPRLRLAPNFLTAPYLEALLLDTQPPGQGKRDIDIHARLGGVQKKGWYGEMRRHGMAAVERLGPLAVASGTGISSRAFMSELRRSKICFSPFGYGEIAWRDIEAIAAGAVLLKPDMSHLRTAPDLFRDDESYVACRWDFSDLPEVVGALLDDAPRRDRIARRAWQIAHDYLSSGGPVDTYCEIFSPRPVKEQGFRSG